MKMGSGYKATCKGLRKEGFWIIPNLTLTLLGLNKKSKKRRKKRF